MKTCNILKSLTMAFAVAAFALIATANTANAQLSTQCIQFLKPHSDFLKNQTQGKGVYKLHVVFVSIGGNQYVRYGMADLTVSSFPVVSGIATIYTNSNTDNTNFNAETRNMILDLGTGRITMGGQYSYLQCNNLIMSFMPSTTENNTFYYWVMNLRDKFEPQ